MPVKGFPNSLGPLFLSPIISKMQQAAGWDASADAWIACVQGDNNRRLVLDGPMIAQCGGVAGKRTLDVGCGEGRFCRMLAELGARTIGIDPTKRLIDRARELHPEGEYWMGSGEALPFQHDNFDLVVSYLVLIDIDDYQAAIREMARVVRPGGKVVVANLQSFATTRERPWVFGENGERLHFAVDNYNEDRAQAVGWCGVSIINHHRPLHRYLNAFLDSGLMLRRFLEPIPTEEGLKEAPDYADYLRIPLMNVMTWEKPA